MISGYRCGVRSSLLWDVTHRRLVVTDVSGQRIGPILDGMTLEYVDWYLVTDVSGQPFGSILDCLTLEDVDW